MIAYLLLNQHLAKNVRNLVANNTERVPGPKDELETFDLKKIILENYLTRDKILSMILKESTEEEEKVPLDQRIHTPFKIL